MHACSDVTAHENVYVCMCTYVYSMCLFGCGCMFVWVTGCIVGVRVVCE